MGWSDRLAAMWPKVQLARLSMQNGKLKRGGEKNGNGAGHWLGLLVFYILCLTPGLACQGLWANLS
jgi:hypothetical protein